jgi:preprotein translocase subunit SecF
MAFSMRRVATSGFAIWVVLALLGIWYLIPLRKKLRFGIDLVGGTYITLGVQVEKAIETEL